MPDLVIHTRTIRTEQTARIIARVLGGEVLVVRGISSNGWASGKTRGDVVNRINGRLKAWLACHEGLVSCVFFVGHHSSHAALFKALGLASPGELRGNGTVLVCRPDGGGWELESAKGGDEPFDLRSFEAAAEVAQGDDGSRCL